jgi:tetratricopeptide (TPR) repeat protein
MAEHEERTADDLCLAAHACSELGLMEDAVELCDQGLEQDPGHVHLLNNKGYFYNGLELYREAVSLFDRAIDGDAACAYAYNNRGFAKIKLGQWEEGLKDISHSLELDKDNGYVYRNLGMYHLEKGEIEEALHLFEKAKAMDSTMPLLEEFIGEAKKNRERKAQELTA